MQELFKDDDSIIDSKAVEDGALKPLETPLTEQGSSIIESMADTTFVNYIQKAAENAPIVQAAMMKIMVSISYPDDWSDHDGTSCLSSAGAERYLKHFPIDTYDFKVYREDAQDEIGKWTKFTYTCIGSMLDRRVQAQGIYSTRDRFLGYIGKEPKPYEDININSIMSAARHICIGNAIKTLLGLRGIPTAELKAIFTKFGKDPNAIKSVSYTRGGQGGKQVAAENGAGDDETRKSCNAMLAELTGGKPAAIKDLVINLSKFTNAEGKEFSRDNINNLAGKWLKTFYGNLQKYYNDYKKDIPETQAQN